MRPALLLVALAVLGVGVASANTPPLADAGLDQHVEENATVYLDAGGSTDPDGEITGHEWSITAPDGTDIDPECVTCERTEFVPEQTGQYNATVAVTDDDGATREDTLYVHVEAATPPGVTLSGPGVVLAGDTQTYTAEASAGGDDLSTITWRVDGSHREHVEASGDSETDSREFSFEAGEHTVTAVVIDESGKRDSEEMIVTAVEPVGGDGEGGGGGGSGGGGEALGGQEGQSGMPDGLTTGNGDGIIQFDTETGEFTADIDQAERSTGGKIEIGDESITMQEIENLDSPGEVEGLMDRKDISEEDAVKRATRGTNDPVGKDELSMGVYTTRETPKDTDDEAVNNVLNNPSDATTNDNVEVQDSGGDDPVDIVDTSDDGGNGGDSGGGSSSSSWSSSSRSAHTSTSSSLSSSSSSSSSGGGGGSNNTFAAY